MSEWMIDNNDPARQEVVARARELHTGSDPDQAAHFLGEVTLADGKVVNAHVIHSSDAIITDGANVVVIERLHDPGKGKTTFPGGMSDPKSDGQAETAIETAAREAREEAGADLSGIRATLVGSRKMNRPHDVRIAKGNGLQEKYGVQDGDVFMVSAQIVRFDVPDVSALHLFAGDDAKKGSARPAAIKSLSRGTMGIGDHFDFLMETFPHLFPKAKPGKQPRP